MKSISSAVNILSISLFVASLVKMLAPKGKTEKILTFVISLFVIICIVTCFTAIATDIDASDVGSIIDEQSLSELESKVNNDVIKITGDYMVQYVKAILEAENIKPAEIKITVDTNENSVINLTEACIYISKKDLILKSEIEDIIKNDLGITPKVIAEE